MPDVFNLSDKITIEEKVWNVVSHFLFFFSDRSISLNELSYKTSLRTFFKNEQKCLQNVLIQCAEHFNTHEHTSISLDELAFDDFSTFELAEDIYSYFCIQFAKNKGFGETP